MLKVEIIEDPGDWRGYYDWLGNAIVLRRDNVDRMADVLSHEMAHVKYHKGARRHGQREQVVQEFCCILEDYLRTGDRLGLREALGSQVGFWKLSEAQFENYLEDAINRVGDSV